jgi:poly-gamma-glutamate synthesis protein (capsule biosynthesis protein)
MWLNAAGSVVFVDAAAPSKRELPSILTLRRALFARTATPFSWMSHRASLQIQSEFFRRALMHRSLSGRATAKVLLSLLLAAMVTAAGAQKPAATEDARITLAGDSIVNRKLSVFDDPSSTGLYDFIRQSDAAFTNFETLVTNYAYPGAAVSGGAYQSSPSWIPSELKWAGFNIVSTANNHAFDYGVAGMQSTLRALDEAGLAHAGTGDNLALARSPAFLDTKKGRVALVAVASTFTEGSLAGEQRPDLVGRPGVNPLRFTATYTVNHDEFEALKRAAALTAGGGEGGEGNATHSPDVQSRVRLGSLQFQLGISEAVSTQPNKSDLEALEASVRDAHRQADWVIVSSHTHESGPGGQSLPPEFLIIAAHAAIDSGADIFVAHGPHILRGIEIYKGKPIFYSLGNFIFENETMLFQPAESYESSNLPESASVADYFDNRSANDTRGFPVNKAVWESVVAQISFHPDHTLDQITLVPISLGYMEPRSQRGRPRLSSPERSKATIDEIAKLSAPYGTTVTYRVGRGFVDGATK